MLPPTDAAAPGFGVKFNARAGYTSHRAPPADCPAWANPAQAADWQQGVVLWQDADRRIVVLSGRRSLAYLAQLRSTQAWMTEGLRLTEEVVEYRSPQRRRSSKPESGAPAQESAYTSRQVEWELMRLTPDQAQTLLACLEQHAVALQQMADAEQQAFSEALQLVYHTLLETYRARETQEFDWSVRPVPWRQDGSEPRWTGILPSGRAEVALTPTLWHWAGCVDRIRPHDWTRRRFLRLAEAVAWAEEQLLQVDSGTALPAGPVAGEMATAVRPPVDLAPYRIEPAALEPARVTYRVVIEFDAAPERCQVLQLAGARQLRYDAQYPTASQLAARLRIDAVQFRLRQILPEDGWYRGASTVTYYRESVAVEQAQLMWDRSRIVEEYRTGQLLRARYGLQEIETGYVAWLGACEDAERPWGEPQGRAEYLADKAAELTLAYALDLDGMRAWLGAGTEVGDELVLRLMHRRRAESGIIPAEARAESARWLAEHEGVGRALRRGG